MGAMISQMVRHHKEFLFLGAMFLNFTQLGLDLISGMLEWLLKVLWHLFNSLFEFALDTSHCSPQIFHIINFIAKSLVIGCYHLSWSSNFSFNTNSDTVETIQKQEIDVYWWKRVIQWLNSDNSQNKIYKLETK